MFQKLRWALKVLRTESYIIITDSESICHIPLVDLTDIDNVLVLSSQTSQLLAIMEQLALVSEEHKKRLEELLKLQEDAQKNIQANETQVKAGKAKDTKDGTS